MNSYKLINIKGYKAFKDNIIIPLINYIYIYINIKELIYE